MTAARELGYRAMQFNLVVETNTAAIRLYRQLGFEIIARQPEAFNLRGQHYLDAFVFHRFLDRD